MRSLSSAGSGRGAEYVRLALDRGCRGVWLRRRQGVGGWFGPMRVPGREPRRLAWTRVPAGRLSSDFGSGQQSRLVGCSSPGAFSPISLDTKGHQVDRRCLPVCADRLALRPAKWTRASTNRCSFEARPNQEEHHGPRCEATLRGTYRRMDGHCWPHRGGLFHVADDCVGNRVVLDA